MKNIIKLLLVLLVVLKLSAQEEAEKPFEIFVNTGHGGTISPGTIEVDYNSTQLFTMIPDSGFVVSSVIVDGDTLGAIQSYEFSNILGNHVIIAYFKAEELHFNVSITARGSGIKLISHDIVTDVGDAIISASSINASVGKTSGSGSMKVSNSVSSTASIQSSTGFVDDVIGGETLVYQVIPEEGYAVSKVKVGELEAWPDPDPGVEEILTVVDAATDQEEEATEEPGIDDIPIHIYVVYPTEAVSVTVETVPTYEVHGTVSPTGTARILPSAFKAKEGSSRCIGFIPEEGYEVDRVEGAQGYYFNGNYTLCFNEIINSFNYTVYMRKKVVKHTVTLNCGSNGTLSLSSPQYVSTNNMLKFHAIPNNGYRVASVDGEKFSGNDIEIGPVVEDITVSVEFEPIVQTHTIVASVYPGLSASLTAQQLPYKVETVEENGSVEFSVNYSDGWEFSEVQVSAGSEDYMDVTYNESEQKIIVSNVQASAGIRLICKRKPVTITVKRQGYDCQNNVYGLDYSDQVKINYGSDFYYEFGVTPSFGCKWESISSDDEQFPTYQLEPPFEHAWVIDNVTKNLVVTANYTMVKPVINSLTATRGSESDYTVSLEVDMVKNDAIYTLSYRYYDNAPWVNVVKSKIRIYWVDTDNDTYWDETIYELPVMNLNPDLGYGERTASVKAWNYCYDGEDNIQSANYNLNPAPPFNFSVVQLEPDKDPRLIENNDEQVKNDDELKKTPEEGETTMRMCWRSYAKDIYSIQRYEIGAEGNITNMTTIMEKKKVNIYYDYDFLPHTTYYYQIKTYGADITTTIDPDEDLLISQYRHESEWSEPFMIKSKLDTPENFTVEQGVGFSLNLLWDPVNFADSYEVVRADDKLFTEEVVKFDVTDCIPNDNGRIIFSDTTITPKKEYYYKVRALSSDGYDSFYSEVFSFTARCEFVTVIGTDFDNNTKTLTLEYQLFGPGTLKVFYYNMEVEIDNPVLTPEAYGLDPEATFFVEVKGITPGANTIRFEFLYEDPEAEPGSEPYKSSLKHHFFLNYNQILHRISYEYDHLGNLTNENIYHDAFVEDQYDAEIKYTYDEQGRIDEVSSKTIFESAWKLEAKYGYNPSDKISSLELNSGDYEKNISYGYDENTGWLNSIGGTAFTSDLNYYANGNIHTNTFSNEEISGAVSTYTYDAIYSTNRLTGVSTTGLTGDMAAYSSEVYAYNQDGAFDLKNRTGQKIEYERIPNTKTNKLSHVVLNDVETKDFEYDAKGNMIYDGFSEVNLFEYDRRNLTLRMKTNNSISKYRYNAEGNRIIKFSTATVESMNETARERYLYDIQGRPVAVYSLDGLKTIYLYGHDLIGRIEMRPRQVTYDNLTLSSAPDVVLKDVYYKGQVEMKEGFQTNIEQNTYAGPDIIVPQTAKTTDAQERFYYIKDHLGSTRLVYDEIGNPVEYMNYMPYGEIINKHLAEGIQPGKFKFTGKERDIETNYDYFGARYYNNKLGLWNSVDPLAGKYPGWSPYNYVADNPINKVDPNGKWWQSSERTFQRTVLFNYNLGSFLMGQIPYFGTPIFHEITSIDPSIKITEKDYGSYSTLTFLNWILNAAEGCPTGYYIMKTSRILLGLAFENLPAGETDIVESNLIIDEHIFKLAEKVGMGHNVINGQFVLRKSISGSLGFSKMKRIDEWIKLLVGESGKIAKDLSTDEWGEIMNTARAMYNNFYRDNGPNNSVNQRNPGRNPWATQ